MKMIPFEAFKRIIGKFPQVRPIAVIGDIGVDKYTLGDVHRISPEAPVPILNVTKEWCKLGLAANVSDNLKVLGVPTTLLGVIGDDFNGRLFLDLMEKENLKTDGVLVVNNRSTTFKERITTPVQQICRIDYETKQVVSDECASNLVAKLEKMIKEHDVIILEDYGKGVVTEKFSRCLIDLIKANGKFLAVDPSRVTPPTYYKGASLLKPNHEEAIKMVELLGYQERKLETVAEILIDKLEINKLIITLGKDGMAIIDSSSSNGIVRIPTVANEVFDVSGAGDTVIATICAAFATGATLEESAWIGNCAAGVVVGKKGTATVNIDELTEFYHKLINKFSKI